jgi:sugar phosphate isomerase/epimerase
MQLLPNRRTFLVRSALACTGVFASPAWLSAIEPFKRPGAPRLSLSLAAYSFREYFADTTEARRANGDSGKRIDLFQFIDFCAAHHCHGAELTSYYFPKNVDQDFLLKLRRHAFLRGVSISGTAVGNTFTHPTGAKRDGETALVKKWIDHASVLGAPHIRVFAGDAPRGTTKAEAKKLCLAALEECAEYAGRKGVFLGMENHGGIVAEADDLLDLIREVKSPWVGINLDTGNFHTNDPYDDLARCAPYAVNVQLKAEIRPRNQREQSADLPRLFKILRDANYQGYVAIEYESSEDPWKAVPALLKRCAELING